MTRLGEIPIKLAATQTLFTACIEPHGDPVHKTDMLNLILETGAISPDLTLRIYANNSSGAPIKSLVSAYPACFPQTLPLSTLTRNVMAPYLATSWMSGQPRDKNSQTNVISPTRPEGIRIGIWVEKGLLFALTEDTGLEPIIQPE